MIGRQKSINNIVTEIMFTTKATNIIIFYFFLGFISSLMLLNKILCFN